MDIKNVLDELSCTDSTWHSVVIGEVDSKPVSARVMQEYEAPFHIHEVSEEMFIVLDGELHIDMEHNSIRLTKGQAFTVPAGAKHRARVPIRAELIVIGGKDVE